MRYIALLRGVNVGGKNKISMPALKQTFQNLGFQAVESYINSGNILFSAKDDDIAQIKVNCEAAIKSDFGLDIAVGLFEAGAVAAAIEGAPGWWGQDSESKHNAIFVIPPTTAAEIMARVGETKPEYEKVGCSGPVIFWSASLKTFSRTRYSKIVGTQAYGNVTIRNANTAKKLAELALKAED